EMAVSSTQAKPGRKWRLRKQIRAQRWCNEDRTVLPGHYVHAVVNVLIAVIDDRDFDGQGSNAFPAFQSSGQVCLEAESIAEGRRSRAHSAPAEEVEFQDGKIKRLHDIENLFCSLRRTN